MTLIGGTTGQYEKTVNFLLAWGVGEFQAEFVWTVGSDTYVETETFLVEEKEN